MPVIPTTLGEAKKRGFTSKPVSIEKVSLEDVPLSIRGQVEEAERLGKPFDIIAPPETLEEAREFGWRTRQPEIPEIPDGIDEDKLNISITNAKMLEIPLLDAFNNHDMIEEKIKKIESDEEILTNIPPFIQKEIEKPFTTYHAVEGMASTLTSLGMFIPSGVAGAFAFVMTGGDVEMAQSAMDVAQGKYIYSPRTIKGAQFAETLSKPFEWLFWLSTKVGDATLEMALKDQEHLYDLWLKKAQDNPEKHLPADKNFLQKEFENPHDFANEMVDFFTIISPELLATIAETATAFFTMKLMGKIGKIPKALKESTWYRRATIKERALVAQSIEDLKASGVSDAAIARLHPSYFEKLLKERAIPEEIVKPIKRVKPLPKKPEVVKPGEVVVEPIKPEVPKVEPTKIPEKVIEKQVTELVEGKITPDELIEPEPIITPAERLKIPTVEELKARVRKVHGVARISELIIDEEGLQMALTETTEIAQAALKSQKQELLAKEKEKIKGLKIKIEDIRKRVSLEKTRSKEVRNQIVEQFRVERQEIQVIKKQITDYVKENIPVKEQGKALIMVRDAKTQKNLEKAFSRINKIAEKAYKKIEKEEIVKRFKRIVKSPSVAIDYKKKAEAIIPFIGTKKKLTELRGFVDFLEKQLSEGKDVEIPLRLVRAMWKADKKSFDELSLKEMETINSELALIEKLGRTKIRVKKELYEQEKREILDAVVASATPIEKIKKLKVLPGEKLTPSQKLKNYIIDARNQMNRIDKVITPIDVIFDIFDGSRGTYDGVTTKFFKQAIDRDFNEFLELYDKIAKDTIALVDRLKITDEQFNKIAFVAAREQVGGREKLHNLNYTDKEIDAVKLTAEEQQVLDAMRADFKEQLPFIQQVMKDIYNVDVKEVQNYFRFTTDWKAMEETEMFLRFIESNIEDTGMPRKNVDLSYTIERKAPGKQKIKLNAMEIYLKTMSDIAYLRTMARDTKMLFEVANTEAFGEVTGDIGQLLVLEWLDVIARKGGASGAKQIAAVDWMRRNFSAGVLGLKISSAAIQWTALIDGMGMIGAEWGIKGVDSIVTSKEWREFVMKFPELKERTGGELAIRELVDGVWLQKLQRKGFIPLQTIDRITASMVVAGAYRKKMAELGEPIDLTIEPNKEAMEYAQLVMRRTQASAMFKDLPLALSRGALTGNRSVDRAFFQFQTFTLYRFSRMRHDAIRVGIKTKDAKHAANVMFWIMLASLLAAGTRLAVNRTIDFITGDDEKDELSEEALKSFAFETTGTIPFVGNIMGSYVYDAELFPLLSAPKGVVKGMKTAIEGKETQAKIRGTAKFTTSLMAVFGIPGAMQAQQLIGKTLKRPKDRGRRGRERRRRERR